MQKLLCVFLLLTSLSLKAENNLEVHATLVPDTGSFVAKSNKVKGRLIKKGNVFTADRLSVLVNSFSTENKLRDKHFGEHIGGGSKLPNPRVEVTNLKAQNGKGTATIKINNVSRPIDITYTEKKGYVDAEFFVNAKDFNLPRAQYLGVGVEDKVRVTVKYDYEVAP